MLDKDMRQTGRHAGGAHDARHLGSDLDRSTAASLQVRAPRASKKDLYEAAVKAAGTTLDAKGGATTPRKKAAAKPAAEAPAAEAPVEDAAPADDAAQA